MLGDEKIRKVRVWPQNEKEDVLMRAAHGRTEIFIYRVERRNKERILWQVPVSKDLVVAVAIDKKRNVYLVRQIRPAWGREVLVLPGGAVEKEKSEEEDRVNDIRRELRQEIGYDCDKPEKLATVLCSARIKSKHYIYLAMDLKKPKESNQYEELEEYEKDMQAHVEMMPLDKALEKFENGEEETTGYTLLGLLLARERLKAHAPPLTYKTK